MKIVKVSLSDYEKYSGVIINYDCTCIGLYDELDDIYFALLPIKNNGDATLVGTNNLYILNQSDIVLKIFEVEMKKFMKLNKFKSVKICVDENIDISRCGMKFIDSNKREIVIYASLFTKIVQKNIKN